ncbi:MAG TPA: hypothetical protein VLZ54_00095, partial [Arenibacter sp.]|nr:hypothetical protein [Arenibacter sp.]
MNKAIYFPILLIFFTTNFWGQAPRLEYYQLKTYLLDTEAQELRTDDYLSKSYLPALKRQGISNIGVFKPRSIDALNPRSIQVLIPLTSLSQLETLEDRLRQDKAHIASGKDFLDAPYDSPPYGRAQSIVLRAFVDMPKMRPSPLTGPRKDRVYELRSYESATESKYRNKVAMFNEGGEVVLFEELGFNAVFYAEVLSGANMPNLMYMTTFEDMDSRDAHWES